MDLNLKIEYLPVDSLKPYENNAREHGEDGYMPKAIWDAFVKGNIHQYVKNQEKKAAKKSTTKKKSK